MGRLIVSAYDLGVVLALGEFDVKLGQVYVLVAQLRELLDVLGGPDERLIISSCFVLHKDSLQMFNISLFVMALGTIVHICIILIRLYLLYLFLKALRLEKYLIDFHEVLILAVCA